MVFEHKKMAKTLWKIQGVFAFMYYMTQRVICQEQTPKK